MSNATRPTSIVCARCGAEKAVGQRGPIPMYCSGACRAGEHHDRRVQIDCAHCDQPATVRTGTRYCSPRCRNASAYQAAHESGQYDAALVRGREATVERQAANSRPCPYCGDRMLNPQRVQCGKPDCKRAFNAERARAWHRNYSKTTGERYGRRYREWELAYLKRRRETLGHWRTQYPDLAALADARRRMLMQQADQGERFAPLDVHERDGWTCGLCRLPVDPGLPWPHPMSPSVDHILPLSRGGMHALANVQSAHLSCNSRKRDRSGDDAQGGAA